MINIETENLIPFQLATKHIPGRRVSLQTLHRWRLVGVRGAILDTCLIGVTRYTSTEAINRFITEQNTPGTVGTTEQIEAATRNPTSAKVRKQLEQLGV